MLAISLLGFVAVKANNTGPGNPGNGRKNELNGVVIHAETKKPLKDVTVTAYLVSKKEKVDITNEEGIYNFDELKPGTYKFVFEKAGFKKITRDRVVVKTDETFQLNIEMIESSNYEIMPSPFNF